MGFLENCQTEKTGLNIILVDFLKNRTFFTGLKNLYFEVPLQNIYLFLSIISIFLIFLMIFIKKPIYLMKYGI